MTNEMKPIDMEKSRLKAKIIELEIDNKVLKGTTNSLKAQLFEAKIRINLLEEQLEESK